MSVIPIDDVPVSTIVGVTQSYCVHQLADASHLLVSSWRDLALANICPADPLLPNDVRENDHRNASATVLRELLALERIGSLTSDQQATRDSLIGYLIDQ
jgi:hypothetical protein